MIRPRQNTLFQVNPPTAQWAAMARHRALVPDRYPMELKLEYAPQPSKARKGPRIRLATPMRYIGGDGVEVLIHSVPLLTNTSKMTCPSFSMPAGPIKRLAPGAPETRGTCAVSLQPVAAKLRKHPEVERQFAEAPEYEHRTKRRISLDPPLYICDERYAGKGLYSIPLNAIRLTLKLAWVRAAIGKRAFVGQMARAIEFMRDLPPVAQEKEGINAKFFRIHDSGDFFSPGYYRAWVRVCEAVPDVQFWAPTRQWVFPAWRKEFTRTAPPPNLAVRPSALFFGAPPPRVSGLEAGSTAAKDAWLRPVWNCPAYENDDASTKNCESVHCRMCWKRGGNPVSYQEH